jgi:acetyl-CoA carboxylase biotin carboxylase subunit
MSLEQNQVRWEGCAIECRINAEDPDNDFRPAPGRVCTAIWPSGEGIRVDTHINSGAGIPPFYDSLLAKIIAYGPDRRSALERMQRAVSNTHIEGVANNLPFHAAVLADPDFATGGVDTSYVPRLLERRRLVQEPVTHA